MIKINEFVYGYCPEFDESSHEIKLIYTNSVNIGGQFVKKVGNVKCKDSYNCQYVREHNGQCPLINKHIDDIKYC